MKTPGWIAGVALMGVAASAFGSEFQLTLEQKVLSSELVVIGTVTQIRLGQIRQLRDQGPRTQDTMIRFRVDECLMGKEKGVISIEAHSVAFSDGGVIHGATAGFSKEGIHRNGRFIAYLKKTRDGYLLAGESNQFMEWIDDAAKSVRATGQTADMVPMARKRRQISEIVAERQNTRKAR